MKLFCIKLSLTHCWYLSDSKKIFGSEKERRVEIGKKLEIGTSIGKMAGADISGHMAKIYKRQIKQGRDKVTFKR